MNEFFLDSTSCGINFSIKNSWLDSFCIYLKSRPWLTPSSVVGEMSVHNSTKHACSIFEWKKLEQSTRLYAATVYP